MIVRNDYYSLTEVVKKFKISRVKYHKLIQEMDLPIETVNIDYGTYQINTIYIKKEIIDSLNLPLRSL